MSQISSPTKILTLLHDIHKRSLYRVAKLSQDDLHEIWTAIGFRIGQTNLLMPLSETKEVLAVPTQITPVPKSHAWVYGITSVRGKLLPLFDLNYFIYGQATKINERSRIIVSNHPQLYSGLLLDEVYGVKHFRHKPDVNNITSDCPISHYLIGQIDEKERHWDVFSFYNLATDPRFLNAAV